MDIRELTDALAEGTPQAIASSALTRAVADLFEANPEITLPTKDMIEAILPAAELRGPQNAARQRAIALACRLANNTLQPFTTRSSIVKRRFGREIHPINWHAAKSPVTLPEMPQAPLKVLVNRPASAPEWIRLTGQDGTTLIRADQICSIEGEPGLTRVTLINRTVYTVLECADDVRSLMLGHEPEPINPDDI